MAMTKVQIISFAISKLGNKQITSLDNQSDIVNAGEQAFDVLFPVSISEHTWRFCCRIQQVSQLVTEPIVSRWRYIYQLPRDYLRMIKQDPHNYEFEIYELKHMYSNMAGPLYIEYMYQPVIAQLPYYFNNYLALRIADHLALSNAHNVAYSQKLRNDMEVARTQALAADAQNRPQSAIASQPIISSRAVSGTPFTGIEYA